MLYLKEANMGDIEKEFDFVKETPKDENGFTNPYSGCTKEEFEYEILPRIIDYSNGIGLPDGFVPETSYFLWDDETVVGWFRLRHFLNDFLKNGAGHIGYGIGKNCRGKGYATIGLKLTVEKAWGIIKEEEIYMSVHKDNPASLQVQKKNGAYIHHEDDKEFYTRIKR